MKSLLAAFAFLFLICACNHNDKKDDSNSETIQFDKIKWKIKEGDDYPYRDKMLRYLLTNDTLKKLRKGEVLEFLGQPDRIDSSYFFYSISQKRLGSFPLNSKTLVVKFKSDSTVEWRKLHE